MMVFSSRRRLLAAWPLMAALAALLGSPAGAVSVGADAAFRTFVAQHKKSYEIGSEEYARRRALFEARLAQVEAHNARPGQTWQADTLRFADWTDSERERLRGWRPAPQDGGDAGAAALLQESEGAPAPELPASADWRNLTVAREIPEQGACGSCWAVTTAATLEAHREIHMRKSGKLSAQELVSCVQNPRHCGGKGGCDGATVELGMSYALHNGLGEESEVPYHAKDIPCAKSHLEKVAVTGGGHHVGSTALGLTGFRTLPSNKQEPLMRAVAERGPVAVSASAHNWFEYKSGVFDACQKDAVVDHAITMYG